jgi:ribose transport system ATP-binding protein
MTEPAPLLHMRDIAKHFGGVHALRGVDFSLRGGEVHALLGENGAGKSTLINVLSGLFPDYEGAIEIEGRAVEFHRPVQAQAAGVATIHQELDLVPEMTVAENLFLGREPRDRLRLVDRRRMRTDAIALLARAGVALDPARRIRSLRVGERQLVEIAKALSQDARILVMDEPTAALADHEVEQLFRVVRELRRAGVGVIYISHRLEELEKIADRATVLRDGLLVGTVELAQSSRRELIGMMVGQPLRDLFPKGAASAGDELLALEGFGLEPRRPRPGRSEPRGITLRVRKGEIVGLAGLMGAGRTELLETLFGAGSPGRRTGTARLDGRPYEPGSAREAIAAGVGLVPEDRKDLGLVLGQSIESNVTLAALHAFARGGLVSGGRAARAVDRAIAELGIKAPSRRAPVRSLSGGNQQKVVFAKQLLTRPRLLLLDEPTRGVDVGAKAEIYRLLARLAEKGMGILLASSELPELLGVCDRIAVLRAGAVVAEQAAADATQESLLEAATSSGPIDEEAA